MFECLLLVGFPRRRTGIYLGRYQSFRATA
jgi:hypothetical protein